MKQEDCITRCRYVRCFCFSNIWFEILHVLCLSLSSHYGFKSSSGRVQCVQENLLYQSYYTSAGFESVSQYTAQHRVAAVKKFSKFSKSTFDSLPASGISWWLKLFRCNEHKMVVPKCWREPCNPSMIMEPSRGGNVSSTEIQRWGYTVFSATTGRRMHKK